MNEEQSGPMIVAIGADNDFLHVYDDDQKLLADDTIGAGEGEKSGPLEFFDSDGYRLVGTYNQQWELVGLTRTEEPPNTSLVRWRVRKTFDHLRGYLKRNQEKMNLQGPALESALELIPKLDESTDFEKFLRPLVHREQSTARIGPLDRGDPVHNWRHACGWNH